ncbi:MAG: hypothetical protein H0W23_04685 [Chloroflexia bacterium]|nr:hypothetical protein [Chloroflexia bacterium]
MRKRASVVVRLFVMLVMALGLATLMSSPAAAQSSQTGQCQTIISGAINQQPCTINIDSNGQCQVIVGDQTFQNAQGCGLDSCPRQITSGANIFQFQCDGVTATATNVPATATNVPATATNVPATSVPATTAPGATQTPVTPDATQAPEVPDEEEEEPVDALPDTGQGSSSGQSNSANVLLLGAMGTVLALGAVAMRLRGNR